MERDDIHQIHIVYLVYHRVNVCVCVCVLGTCERAMAYTLFNGTHSSRFILHMAHVLPASVRMLLVARFLAAFAPNKPNRLCRLSQCKQNDVKKNEKTKTTRKLAMFGVAVRFMVCGWSVYNRQRERARGKKNYIAHILCSMIKSHRHTAIKKNAVVDRKTTVHNVTTYRLRLLHVQVNDVMHLWHISF